MVLGLTQPLTEMSTSTSYLSGGKGGRCVGLTTLPTSCVDCQKFLEPQTPEAVRASLVLCRHRFTFCIVFFICEDCFLRRTVYSGCEFGQVVLTGK
jgi:hypothetical protein